MSRRRRRAHADPATLPRRDPAQRPERTEREQLDRAARELARVQDALARAIAVMGAALVYFGAWALNEAFALYPQPTSVDLAHPQFIIGIAALTSSILVARLLVRRYDARALVALGRWAVAAFGVLVLASTVGIGLAGPAAPALGLIALGMAISWLIATLWVTFLGRRAHNLLNQLGAQAG